MSEAEKEETIDELVTKIVDSHKRFIEYKSILTRYEKETIDKEMRRIEDICVSKIIQFESDTWKQWISILRMIRNGEKPTVDKLNFHAPPEIRLN